MFSMFQLEWKNACRRSRHHSFRSIYGLLVLAELLFFHWAWGSRVIVSSTFGSQPPGLVTAEAAWQYYEWLAFQHFLLIVLITPALAAGSIADEKTSGTLVLLLTSDLTATEIILGKWLAQFVQVVILVLPTAPALVYLHALGGLHDVSLLTLLLETLLLAMTLAAVGLLASVWSRQTNTAVLLLYALLTVALLTSWLTGFNPVTLFSWRQPSRQLAGDLIGNPAWLGLMTTLAGVCIVCLVLACWRLRPAFAAQSIACHRFSTLTAWLQRPPVNDSPIRWKERYVGELGLFAFCRLIPRWLGLTLVLLTGLLIGFFLDGSDEAFLLHGLGMIVLAGGWTAVRGSGVITGEREKQTWEGLLLTPLEPYFLVRGKLWGIIDGMTPYLVAYLIAALLWAVPNGIQAGLWTLYSWMASWGLLYFQAANAIHCSARSASSWQALVKALVTGVVAVFTQGFIVAMPAYMILLGIVAGMPFCLIAGSPPLWYFVLLMIGITPVVLLLFSNAEIELQEAEKLIAEQDRIKQTTDQNELLQRRLPNQGAKGVPTS